MRAGPPPASSKVAGPPGRVVYRSGERGLHVHRPVPLPQIQITPLIDVLLVLLVLGVLAGSAAQTGTPASAKSLSTTDALAGLSLPLRSGVDAAPMLTPADDRLWMGLGLQGRLSWREVPVTRDILARQLREALSHNRHAEVWLAVDQDVPYADLLPWLEWLQTQQVTRLTLLRRAAPPVPGSGKP